MEKYVYLLSSISCSIYGKIKIRIKDNVTVLFLFATYFQYSIISFRCMPLIDMLIVLIQYYLPNLSQSLCKIRFTLALLLYTVYDNDWISPNPTDLYSSYENLVSYLNFTFYSLQFANHKYVTYMGKKLLEKGK